MHKQRDKLLLALIFCGLMGAITPAAAQSAEETIAVGLDVQINPPPGISGLDDIAIVPTKGCFGGYCFGEASDPFCIFVPAADFFSLRTIGTNPDSSGGSQILSLEENQSGTDLQMDYQVRVETTDATSTQIHIANAPDKETTGIATADLVNGNTPDCGGSSNVVFTVTVSGSAIDFAAFTLPPGQTYSFTDQLSLIITPDI